MASLKSSSFNGSACGAFRSNPPSDRQTNQPTSQAASFEAAAGERSATQQQHPHHHHHCVGRCVSDRKCSIRSGRAQRAEWEKGNEAAATIATTFRQQIFPEPRFLVHLEPHALSSLNLDSSGTQIPQIFQKPRFLPPIDPALFPKHRFCLSVDLSCNGLQRRTEWRFPTTPSASVNAAILKSINLQLQHSPLYFL